MNEGYEIINGNNENARLANILCPEINPVCPTMNFGCPENLGCANILCGSNNFQCVPTIPGGGGGGSW